MMYGAKTHTEYMKERGQMPSVIGRVDKIESGKTVNSIGEVQGKGGHIDSLCGRLTEMRDVREYLEAIEADLDEAMIEGLKQ